MGANISNAFNRHERGKKKNFQNSNTENMTWQFSLKIYGKRKKRNIYGAVEVYIVQNEN